MSALDERYEKGQSVRAQMAHGDPSLFALPGIDQLAPDLKRIIDESLYGSIWSRPGLGVKERCICTLAALMALGQLPPLRRHIERGLNLGLPPEQVVEVFVLMTFYVGVPAVETALRITKEVFEDRGIQFTPTEAYDPSQSPRDLSYKGARTYEQNLGEMYVYANDHPISEEIQWLIYEYHWGAIYNRPHLDARTRAMCALSAMAVQGRYDRQMRRRIEGALLVGLTPSDIMEVFLQVLMYGGYIAVSTVIQIAGSVFTEQGLITPKQS